MKYSPGAPSTCIIHLKENKQTKNERLRRGNVYGSGSKNAKKVNKKVVLSDITKTRNYVSKDERDTYVARFEDTESLSRCIPGGGFFLISNSSFCSLLCQAAML